MAEPGEVAADVTSARGSSSPDASSADIGEGRDPSDAAPNLDAGAAPSPSLVCREECTCDAGVLGEFMFCPTPVTHDEALARCSLAGGSLAGVDDPVRNDWLTTRMVALAADDFWLSGTDSEDEGVWRWSDGRVFFDPSADAGAARPYAPWDAEQPNDLNGEDCMRSSGGVWRDLDCSEQIAFVCQR